MEVTNAVGRRKSAIARVYLTEGTGRITVNEKDIEIYSQSAILRYVVKRPLETLEAEGRCDIKVNLDGGELMGQNQALCPVIARAPVKLSVEDKRVLRDNRFLTRDSRTVEHKKPGQPKAHRRFQFDKY